MKVYQMRGKYPLKEIKHIKSLLGDLYLGHQAYVPEHTDQDSTIVLKEATQGILQWWQQTQAILQQNGYVVEDYP